MQAAVISKIGNLKYLSLKEISPPQPAYNEALIEIEYCGLNHLDLFIIEGKRPGPKNFPHILGSEFVGKIVHTGEKVAVYPWTYCGKCEQCKKGNENICDSGGTFGRTRWGGYAQFATVPIKNLVKIPDDLSSKLVCASVLSSITAYHMTKRAEIRDNSTVLITGATGGVGSSAIQFLKNKQCKIICSTSHKEKILKLKKLGVDFVVNINNLLSEVKKIAPDGVDYVMDIMGGNIWSQGVELLVKNGTLVFCSTTLDDPGLVNLASSFSRQINILGSYGGTIQDLKEVINLLQKGVIKPVIDSVYPLNEVNSALSRLGQQKSFGKILINCSI